jgi:hypothetical protein
VIVQRVFLRVILLAAGIFLLASPGMARPAQKQADVVDQQRLPLTLKKYAFGDGTVTGSVINASLLMDVPGAQVCWKSNCTITDGGGEYTLENVANGYQTLTASADGFVTTDQVAYIVGNQVNYQNIAIIPDVELSGLKYRILTTWDDTECWPDPNGVDCWDNDLDAHLWRFDIYTPIQYHIGYFFHYDPVIDQDHYWLDQGDCRGFPNACLERDARRGYGPETMAIKVRELSMYYFGVFNSTQGNPGVPPISQTSAVVRLYDLTGLLKTYEIPADAGDKAFWYVFSLNGETGEVIDRNCVIDYSADYDTTTWPVCP